MGSKGLTWFEIVEVRLQVWVRGRVLEVQQSLVLGEILFLERCPLIGCRCVWDVWTQWRFGTRDWLYSVSDFYSLCYWILGVRVLISIWHSNLQTGIDFAGRHSLKAQVGTLIHKSICNVYSLSGYARWYMVCYGLLGYIFCWKGTPDACHYVCFRSFANAVGWLYFRAILVGVLPWAWELFGYSCRQSKYFARSWWSPLVAYQFSIWFTVSVDSFRIANQSSQ